MRLYTVITLFALVAISGIGGTFGGLIPKFGDPFGNIRNELGAKIEKHSRITNELGDGVKVTIDNGVSNASDIVSEQNPVEQIINPIGKHFDFFHKLRSLPEKLLSSLKHGGWGKVGDDDVSTTTVREASGSTKIKPHQESTTPANKTTILTEGSTTPTNKTTVVPEESTTAADKTTVVSEESTTAANETTVLPEESTTPADETTAVPEESTTATNETTVLPEESTTPADETTAVPEESTTAANETTVVPEESTTAADETTVVPEESTTPANETKS